MMNYNYAQLFANQFDFIDNNPDNLKSPTRSSKVITPIHSAIAQQIQENSEYTTISSQMEKSIHLKEFMVVKRLILRFLIKMVN